METNGTGNLRFIVVPSLQRTTSVSLAKHTARILEPVDNYTVLNMEMAILQDTEQKVVLYYVIYVKNGNPVQLTLGNMLKKNQMFDCGLGLVPFKIGDVITLSGLSKWTYEARMRNKGITMPWIGNIKNSKNKSKKRKCCDHCKARKSKSIKLRLCKKCKRVRYCSRKCQKISWKKHHRYPCLFIDYS